MTNQELFWVAFVLAYLPIGYVAAFVMGVCDGKADDAASTGWVAVMFLWPMILAITIVVSPFVLAHKYARPDVLGEKCRDKFETWRKSKRGGLPMPKDEVEL